MGEGTNLELRGGLIEREEEIERQREEIKELKKKPDELEKVVERLSH